MTALTEQGGSFFRSRKGQKAGGPAGTRGRRNAGKARATREQTDDLIRRLRGDREELPRFYDGGDPDGDVADARAGSQDAQNDAGGDTDMSGFGTEGSISDVFSGIADALGFGGLSSSVMTDPDVTEADINSGFFDNPDALTSDDIMGAAFGAAPFGGLLGLAVNNVPSINQALGLPGNQNPAQAPSTGPGGGGPMDHLGGDLGPPTLDDVSAADDPTDDELLLWYANPDAGVMIDQSRYMAGGGQIKGPGDGRSDAILARVSADEYVVPAWAVSALGRGSSTAGGKRLDQWLDQLGRQARADAGALGGTRRKRA